MRLDLNFASREYLLVGKIYAVLGAGLLAGAAVLLVLVLSHAKDARTADSLRDDVAGREAVLAGAEKRLADYRRVVNKDMLASTYTEADFANYAINRRVFSWTQFLNRLEGLVPDGVGITGIKPNFQDLNVDISGTARDMDSVTRFIERLTRSEYFEDIPPSFSTSEDKVVGDVGTVVQRFNIKIRYIPDQESETSTGEGEG